MKSCSLFNLQLTIIAMLFCMFSKTYANEWERSHYVSLGLGFAITQGDLEGKASHIEKSSTATETVYAPNLGVYFIPELELGAMFNEHTVYVDFSYSNPTTNYGKGTLTGDETDTDIFRLGLGYRYNFFWKEPFQLFASIAYSFMYMSTKDNAYLEKNNEISRSDAVLTGNGFAITLGTLYYLNKHLSMEMHGRIRTMFYTSVGTDENGFSDLNNTYKQYFEELVLKFAYHF